MRSHLFQATPQQQNPAIRQLENRPTPKGDRHPRSQTTGPAQRYGNPQRTPISLFRPPKGCAVGASSVSSSVPQPPPPGISDGSGSAAVGCGSSVTGWGGPRPGCSCGFEEFPGFGNSFLSSSSPRLAKVSPDPVARSLTVRVVSVSRFLPGQQLGRRCASQCLRHHPPRARSRQCEHPLGSPRQGRPMPDPESTHTERRERAIEGR